MNGKDYARSCDVENLSAPKEIRYLQVLVLNKIRPRPPVKIDDQEINYLCLLDLGDLEGGSR